MLAAVLVGTLAGVSPILGITALGGVIAIWLLSYWTRMVPVFHVALIAILIGYAFLGKGMAYVGVAPVYVGEIVLVLGLLAILVSLPTARWHPVHLAIALFAGWGLIRTIPYIGTDGIDALRDGVTYGYAVFAFAVSLTVRRSHVERLLPLYRRWIPVFVFWVPIAAVLGIVFQETLPLVPGSDTPVRSCSRVATPGSTSAPSARSCCSVSAAPARRPSRTPSSGRSGWSRDRDLRRDQPRRHGRGLDDVARSRLRARRPRAGSRSSWSGCSWSRWSAWSTRRSTSGSRVACPSTRSSTTC